MPINIVSNPVGQIMGFLLTPGNWARRTGGDQSRQAQNPPQASEPAGNRVRFDLSASVRQAAAGPAAAASAAEAEAAAGSAAPVAPAAALLGNLASIKGAARQTAEAVPAKAPAIPATGAEPAPPIILDDEAAARAWAIQSLARENRLGLIEQIARVAERPQASASAAPSKPAAAVPVAEAAEPRTLARV